MNHLLRLLFVLPLVLLFSCSDEKEVVSYPVAPPFENINIETQSQFIDPAIEQVVRFSKELSVEIPANAFVDKEGKPVTGKVELSVETYDTPAEILASGIPMKYHDGEKEQDFESAGMFRIEGKCNGQEIEIAKGKELKANYSSPVFGDFDFFYFEEKSAVQQAAFASATAAAPAEGSWKKLTTTPADQYDTSKTLKNFKLQFAEKDYPELAELEEINWHLATSFRDPTGSKNPEVLNTAWTYLDISRPKYVMGEPFLQDEVEGSIFFGGGFDHSPDQNTICLTKKGVTNIFTRKGKRIASIANVESTYNTVHFISNELLLVEVNREACLFNTKGEKLANYGNSYGHKFDLRKKRVVYSISGEFSEPYSSVILSDLNGNTIRSFKLQEDPNRTLGETNVACHFLLSAKGDIITNSFSGINVYDLDGNPVTEKKGKYSDLKCIEPNSVLGSDLDGHVMVWNYITNKTVENNTVDTRTKTIGGAVHFSSEYPIRKRPYVVLQPAVSREGDNSMIWNYQTNQILRLPFSCNYHTDTIRPEIIAGYISAGRIYKVYDLDRKKELVSIPDFPMYGEGIWSPSFSNDGKSMILGSYSHPQLRKTNGTLIKDFVAYDSLITSAGFLSNTTLFTLSSDGVYKIWDIDGKILSSVVLEKQSLRSAWKQGELLDAWENNSRSQVFLSLKGDLVIDPGKSDYAVPMDSSGLIRFSMEKYAQVVPLVKNVWNAWQLTLKNDKKEFQTYIYLDSKTQELVSRYYRFRSKKMAEEKERQAEEEKITRSFEVAKFGIYNWDKMMKQPESILLAADFQFDVPTDYNDITVFLVTDLNGPAVIKYNHDNWDKFRIDPTIAAKLIAVLPGNKISVLREEDLKKINWTKVRQEKKYTFHLKTVDETIAGIATLEKYLQ